MALVDHWGAFERALGPGRVLDRDVAVIEAWDEALRTGRRTWTETCQ